MFKKSVAVITALILIMLSLCGCFGKGKANKSFAVPIIGEPTSLDPQIAKTDSEKMIVLNCYEGLFRIGSDGEIENGVCESYTVSDDGLRYVFKLRQDAHWALFSGHKTVLGENYADTFDINVYAEDFAFAFDRIFDPAINSPYASLFSSVASYSADDKYTFSITLNSRDDNLLYNLTTAGAVPCDKAFYELTGGKYGLDAKYSLCNGPFNVGKWIDGTSVRIDRNNDYNGENKVMPSSVTFYVNTSREAVADKMNNGTYDVAYLNNLNYSRITDKSDFSTQSVENTVYSFVFNQTDKYLANKNVRLALAYSADLSLAGAISDDIKPAVSFVPPYCKVGSVQYTPSDSTGSLYGFDSAKAKDYFEQGLLETGSSSVELEIKCTEEYETFVKQIVQVWQKTLGVKFAVSVTVVTGDELDSTVISGNYSVVFYPFTANTVNTNEFLESFSNNTKFNYTSDRFEAALQQVRESSKDNSRLLESCKNAESVLIDEAVMLPVIYEYSYFIENKDADGIYFYPSGDIMYFINAVKK